MSELNCNKKLRERGLSYPRTCTECGIFGGCKYSTLSTVEEVGVASFLGDIVEGIVEIGSMLGDS